MSNFPDGNALVWPGAGSGSTGCCLGGDIPPPGPPPPGPTSTSHCLKDNISTLYICVMDTNWHGLMKVLEIGHLDVDGKLLWRESNIKNLLHAEGEEFILQTMFSGEASVPTNYYLGLDNRSTLTRADTLSTVSSTEPTSVNGYVRTSVSSTGSFTVSEGDSGVFEAECPILLFSATGGNWGPVSNLFLTNTSDFTGVLISSVLLSSPVTVTDGQTINVRIALSLKDCPTV